MKIESIPTRGRTLDHAASVYDLLEPFFPPCSNRSQGPRFDRGLPGAQAGGRLIIADMHVPTTWMGALVSHVSRWFFLQPQIAENTRGFLPGLITEAGFREPQIVAEYFGYIAVFYCEKQ